MNVFRENCYTCINNRPPMCELYNESTYTVQNSGKCQYTPVLNENEAILHICPEDKHLIPAILNSEATKEVFEEIVTRYLSEYATIYWNIIGGKLYLTVKIKQELENG